MEFGYISPETYPVFKSLLLPQAQDARERGEPITLMGVTEDKTACGALGGYLDGGRYQIVSLYVAPEYRRRGFGRCMVEGLKQLLSEFPEAAGIEVNYTATLPEHDTLKPFLSAMGFHQETYQDQNIYFSMLSEAAESPFFMQAGAKEEKQPSSKSGILPFSQIPDSILAMAERKCRARDRMVPELPLTSPELDREVSHALVRNKEIVAFVTFDHSCCGRLTLSCAWTGNSGPAVLPALLHSVFRKASELYPPDTPLAVQSTNPVAANLIKALLPKAVPISFTYACAL